MMRTNSAITANSAIAAIVLGVFVGCGGGDAQPADAEADPTALTEPVADTTLPFETAAIRYVLGSTPSRFDSTLPGDVRFEPWLLNLLGEGGAIRSEVNDCGEQTGDPAVDAERDIPTCVEIGGRRADGWDLGVRVGVGTFGQGVAGEPAVRMVYVSCGHETIVGDRLGDLERELRSLTASGARCTGYEGMRYPPLPPGLEEMGGALFTDRGTDDHVIAIVRARGEAGTMLWLSRFTHRDAGGQAYWQVRAVLSLDERAAGDVLVFTPGACEIDGARDHEILAVARREDVEVFEEIRRAWRANRALGRFETVPVAGVRCTNMEYGI